jgi:hypothetical protein
VELWLPGGSCTGSLIGWGTIVTAAHCFVPNPMSAAPTQDTSAGIQVSVNLWRPASQTWRCIWPVSQTGKCTSSGQLTAVLLGAYTGTGNWDSDIGLLMPSAGVFYQGVTTSDFLKIYVGSFNSFSSFMATGSGLSGPLGNNVGAGIMRSGGFGLDGFNSYQFWSAVRTGRICHGDSGGPATIVNSGNVMAVGHIVGNTGEIVAPCAVTGNIQHFTRFSGGTGNKIDWISSKMSAFRGESCSASQPGTVGPFRQCF